MTITEDGCKMSFFNKKIKYIIVDTFKDACQRRSSEVCRADEMPLKYFTKVGLCFAVNCSWQDRAVSLSSPTQTAKNLICTYKVVFDLVNGAASDLFTLTSLIHSSGTRGYTLKLFPHCNSVDLYKYFLSQRIIDTWNTLPAKLNDFSSLARFTRVDRSADLSQFLSLGY